MSSESNITNIVENLDEKKSKEKESEKEYSENKCKCKVFLLTIIVDFILTFVYCVILKSYVIIEKTSYHNIPNFPFINLTFYLNFDIRKEKIPFFL